MSGWYRTAMPGHGSWSRSIILTRTGNGCRGETTTSPCVAAAPGKRSMNSSRGFHRAHGSSSSMPVPPPGPTPAKVWAWSGSMTFRSRRGHRRGTGQRWRLRAAAPDRAGPPGRSTAGPSSISRPGIAPWTAPWTSTISMSFRVNIPGIGGGTFHAIDEPELLGFRRGHARVSVPVRFLLPAIGGAPARHEGGWTQHLSIGSMSPSPDQYPFVMNGFAKLKRSCPGIARMLTEQVEPGLIGGPDIWCSITDDYQHERAEARREHGEKFWWYVCTGPKAPYAGTVHRSPAPEMRIWLWQTFQREHREASSSGNQLTGPATPPIPDQAQPQNPYDDPMSWTSGYSTPAGDKRALGQRRRPFHLSAAGRRQRQSSAPVLGGPVDIHPLGTSARWHRGLRIPQHFEGAA